MDILNEDQLAAIEKMHSGCILVGGTGSGKTRTALGYYEKYWSDRDLYVITTAKKRDSGDWQKEAALYSKIRGINVESWNKIEEFCNTEDQFVIFDEQHAVNLGKWGENFIKIAKKNAWITLSATPADTYMDLLCHFIACGYVKNKSEFQYRYVIYNRFITNFPKIEGYINTRQLEKWKKEMYVIMKDRRKSKQIHTDIWCDYNHENYRKIFKDRWNIYEEKPIENVSELCFCMRKCVNSDESRLGKLSEIMTSHDKIIVFYSFDFELEILRKWCDEEGIIYSEFNGHKHENIPDSESWLYLVQYFNSEAWNCIETDTIVFYSQTYSYKNMVQAAGRIDRLNTPFEELFYYHFLSNSPIDIMIQKTLKMKKNFNENRWFKKDFEKR